MDTAKPTIVVTGVSGNLGQRLLPQLADYYKVVGIDVTPPTHSPVDRFVPLDLGSGRIHPRVAPAAARVAACVGCAPGVCDRSPALGSSGRRPDVADQRGRHRAGDGGHCRSQPEYGSYHSAVHFSQQRVGLRLRPARTRSGRRAARRSHAALRDPQERKRSGRAAARAFACAGAAFSSCVPTSLPEQPSRII